MVHYWPVYFHLLCQYELALTRQFDVKAEGHDTHKEDDAESRPSQIGDRDRSIRSLNEVEYGSNPSQIQLASPKPAP
jgi:hypothetical protein